MHMYVSCLSGDLSELQSSDVNQQFDCDSSPERVLQVDSDIEDIPEDVPFRQIRFGTKLRGCNNKG